MNEDFVTYEQAVKLKELGFDWPCTHYYESNTLTPSFDLISNDGGVTYKLSIDDLTCNFNLDNGNSTCVVSAPTLAQVQKWLREEKGIIICIEPRFYKNKKPLVGYEYHLFDKDDGWHSYIESKTVYDTYEEALSEAISKALEILKQENNENKTDS